MNIEITRKRISLGYFLSKEMSGVSEMHPMEITVLVYKATWTQIPSGIFCVQDFTDVETLDAFVREAENKLQECSDRKIQS